MRKVNLSKCTSDSLKKNILKSIESKIKNKKEVIRVVLNFSKTVSYKKILTSNIVNYLNLVCTSKPIIVLCQFEIDKLSSSELLAILKTDSKIIESDYIHVNPFNIETKEIIEKISSEEQKIKSLTKKESEILELIVNGLSTTSISEVCCISKRTVETHKVNIMKKLDVNKLVDLVKFAVKNGVV